MELGDETPVPKRLSSYSIRMTCAIKQVDIRTMLIDKVHSVPGCCLLLLGVALLAGCDAPETGAGELHPSQTTITFGLACDPSKDADCRTGPFAPYSVGIRSEGIAHLYLQDPVHSAAVVEVRPITVLGRPGIEVNFLPEDARLFADFTEQHLGKELVFVFQNKIVARGGIRSRLTPPIPLDGRFSEAERDRLLSQLQDRTTSRK